MISDLCKKCNKTLVLIESDNNYNQFVCQDQICSALCFRTEYPDYPYALCFSEQKLNAEYIHFVINRMFLYIRNFGDPLNDGGECVIAYNSNHKKIISFSGYLDSKEKLETYLMLA